MNALRAVASAAVRVLAALAIGLSTLAAQQPAPPAATLTCTEIEAFLKNAKVGRQRSIPVGVTLPTRTTLDDGTRQHDAAVQTADVSATTYATGRGTELNFRDSWKFNVAGYELAKLLELNMVPPYVERTVAGKPASLSWWVNDAMMDRDRVQKKISPPDVERWNNEMYAARVFRELIGDTDFNQTNTLITKDWRTWMIDFTRAFRRTTTLQHPDNLRKIDRRLLVGIQRLTLDVLQQKVGRHLIKPEMEAILARRNLIVQRFEAEIASKGEAAVLYDLPRISEPCGVGL